MIRVLNISKAYGSNLLFDEVSFVLNPGERLGLVGRNGHGKTTLFRILLGSEAPDDGQMVVSKGYRIGHLSQQIKFSEPSVLAEACTGLPETEDGTDTSYRAKVALDGLGFSQEDLDRSPEELSGGFQVRLNLAKVLISEPNLLLLDEPTNYLDIVSMRWLQRFLGDWRRVHPTNAGTRAGWVFRRRTPLRSRWNRKEVPNRIGQSFPVGVHWSRW